MEKADEKSSLFMNVALLSALTNLNIEWYFRTRITLINLIFQPCPMSQLVTGKKTQLNFFFHVNFKCFVIYKVNKVVKICQPIKIPSDLCSSEISS